MNCIRVTPVHPAQANGTRWKQTRAWTSCRRPQLTVRPLKKLTQTSTVRSGRRKRQQLCSLGTQNGHGFRDGRAPAPVAVREPEPRDEEALHLPRARRTRPPASCPPGRTRRSVHTSRGRVSGARRPISSPAARRRRPRGARRRSRRRRNRRSASGRRRTPGPRTRQSCPGDDLRRVRLSFVVSEPGQFEVARGCLLSEVVTLDTDLTYLKRPIKILD
jgi:hypothetical protein